MQESTVASENSSPFPTAKQPRQEKRKEVILLNPEEFIDKIEVEDVGQEIEPTQRATR